jgi:hypothetical protein
MESGEITRLFDNSCTCCCCRSICSGDIVFILVLLVVLMPPAAASASCVVSSIPEILLCTVDGGLDPTAVGVLPVVV